MNNYVILAVSLIAIGLIMLVQQLYTPVKKVNHDFSSTDFIAPDQSFIGCEQTDDCIKVKGSVCPPSEGGKEVCVNKNYFQEYISTIDERAGSAVDAVCPQIYLATNKTCGCVDSRCMLA